MKSNSLVSQITTILNNLRYYWNEPPKGRFMSFKEIGAYAFGGIGAYFIITMGSALIVSTTNMIVGGAIGVQPTDMYILYIISTLANIPLTAVRANMIDNTRGKSGKYRPYLLKMGLPTAIIALAYVWFPYQSLDMWFTGEILGRSAGYIATCVAVLVFNLLLQFFFNFFNDAYTNLIHVLSPNTQERTDVLAIKAVVYSLAPSIISFVLPLIAQFVADDNLYDIRVYRFAYPVFAILGMTLTIIVYANTREKIVQAKTHTIQISFIDSFKSVAKNKYFWIIALAGWLGFLEGCYGSILEWSYVYGHSTTGSAYSIMRLIVSNASLWGMILAPFCVRKFGKKRVLLGINFANIVCILAMMVNMKSIWWLAACVYLNWLFGAFEQITTPAIQADIRDYHQFKTGERVDGMFATVQTIGNMVTLATSSVLPFVQRSYGIYEGNGYEKPFDILDVNTGEPGLLFKMMGALIIMAAIGAFLNMAPYFFYDLDEKKQKSVIRVLQVRAMFEDYGNKALGNRQLVEAIDAVKHAREMAAATPKSVDKADYMPASKDKVAKKEAKKALKEAKEYNEDIVISQFVCDELDKFENPVFKHQVEVCTALYEAGIEGLVNEPISAIKQQLAKAKALPADTKENKEIRKFDIEFAKQKLSAKKAYDKHYGTINAFVEPDMADLTALFDEDDAINEKINALVAKKNEAEKADDKATAKQLMALIKELNVQLKDVTQKQKVLMDEMAKFNRAAKPYNTAKKLLTQRDNYMHFDDIAALYEQAKIDAEEEERLAKEAAEAKRLEEEAELEAKKAQKAAKKAAKKNK